MVSKHLPYKKHFFPSQKPNEYKTKPISQLSSRVLLPSGISLPWLSPPSLFSSSFLPLPPRSPLPLRRISSVNFQVSQVLSPPSTIRGISFSLSHFLFCLRLCKVSHQCTLVSNQWLTAPSIWIRLSYHCFFFSSNRGS